jgi:hypothetical protein
MLPGSRAGRKRDGRGRRSGATVARPENPGSFAGKLRRDPRAGRPGSGLPGSPPGQPRGSQLEERLLAERSIGGAQRRARAAGALGQRDGALVVAVAAVVTTVEALGLRVVEVVEVVEVLEVLEAEVADPARSVPGRGDGQPGPGILVSTLV